MANMATQSKESPAKITPAQEFVRAINSDWLLCQAFRLKIAESLEEDFANGDVITSWLEHIGFVTTLDEIETALEAYPKDDLAFWDGGYMITRDEGGKLVRHALLITNGVAYFDGVPLGESATYAARVLTFTGVAADAATLPRKNPYSGVLTFSFGEHADLPSAIDACDVTRTCAGRIWQFTAEEPASANARGATCRAPLPGDGPLKAADPSAAAVTWVLDDLNGTYATYTRDSAYGGYSPDLEFTVTSKRNKGSLKYGRTFTENDADLTPLMTAESYRLAWTLDTPGVIKSVGLKGDIQFEKGDSNTGLGKISRDPTQALPAYDNFALTQLPGEWTWGFGTSLAVSFFGAVMTGLSIVASYFIAKCYNKANEAAKAGADARERLGNGQDDPVADGDAKKKKDDSKIELKDMERHPLFTNKKGNYGSLPRSSAEVRIAVTQEKRSLGELIADHKAAVGRTTRAKNASETATRLYNEARSTHANAEAAYNKDRGDKKARELYESAVEEERVARDEMHKSFDEHVTAAEAEARVETERRNAERHTKLIE